MPSPRARLGARGEDIAAAYLEANGLRVRDRNYRTRYGEVDIVAEEGNESVFVEVRTRRSGVMGTPEESVTPRKRRRLATVALQYLQEHGLEDRPWRVDVIAITMDRNTPTINHLRAVDVDYANDTS